MVVLLVSSSSILIIQVRKENDDGDGSQAGNASVCPSALLGTANKMQREEKSMVCRPLYIQIYVQAQILAAWFHSLTVDVGKVSRWYKMMTDCLKPYVLAFSISSVLLGQYRLRWADDNRANFFFFFFLCLSFYIYKKRHHLFLRLTIEALNKTKQDKTMMLSVFCYSDEYSFSIYFSYMWWSFH